jgi:triosephosphate isomerase
MFGNCILFICVFKKDFMNKFYIIANWKMNPQSEEEVKSLLKGIIPAIKSINKEEINIVLLPPFTWLRTSKDILDQNLGLFELGAQNIFWQNGGAYTGEISPFMVKDLGCKYVLIGHSERKIYLSENREMIKKKLKIALKSKLIPILCFHSKTPEEVVTELSFLVSDINKDKLNQIIFVYEPTEAISTQSGEVPSKNKILQIKEAFEQILGQDKKLLYGGSVNAQNIKELTVNIGLDGALVGAKSLNNREFSAIIRQFI